MATAYTELVKGHHRSRRLFWYKTISLLRQLLRLFKPIHDALPSINFEKHHKNIKKPESITSSSFCYCYFISTWICINTYNSLSTGDRNILITPQCSSLNS